MFDSSKRKNDDKARGRSRRIWLKIAVIIIIALVGLVPILHPRLQPMSDMPADKVVYVEDDNLYVVDFETGQRTKTPFPSQPYDSNNTSPDGRWRIRFGSNGDLSVIDLINQQTMRSLGTFQRPDSTFGWSPDQQRVVFTAEPEAGQGAHTSEIWMLTLSTGDITRLTTNTYAERQASFSPDGTQLVYMANADGFSRPHIMDLATGESRMLTRIYYGSNPQWSPDGQWIAFEASYRVNKNAYPDRVYTNIYVIRADGTHSQPVTFGETSSVLIGWQS